MVVPLRENFSREIRGKFDRYSDKFDSEVPNLALFAHHKSLQVRVVLFSDERNVASVTPICTHRPPPVRLRLASGHAGSSLHRGTSIASSLRHLFVTRVTKPPCSNSKRRQDIATASTQSPCKRLGNQIATRVHAELCCEIRSGVNR